MHPADKQSFVVESAKRFYLGKNASEPEFAHIGFDYFDEQFVDFVYRVYLGLIVDDHWRGEQWYPGEARPVSGLSDVGHLYLDGVYVPLAKRLVFSDQIDLKNFELPNAATLVRQASAEAFQFIRVKRVGKLPIGWLAPTRGAYYKLTVFTKKKLDEPNMDMWSIFVLVKPDGHVVPCVSRRHPRDGDVIAAIGFWTFAAVVTINASDDARHLWQVRTGEPLLGGNQKTPLALGCDPERIKSLFYARSLPVTETGRKRPILHWVRAHQRRLESGTDIDISKHLRGIERFEMGGFDFEITSPTKKVAA
jgi:hypothetical protein